MDKPTCLIDDCDRRYYSRGYCSKHYQWMKKHQPERLAPLRTPTTGCKVDDCAEPHKAKGYCIAHYDKLKTYGDPLHETEYRRYDTPTESFAARTEWRGDCLIWTGWKYPNGYGVITASSGREQLVHRWAWEQVHGPIPEGGEIDHRCHNRACCNVKHLRPATSKQNREHQRGAYKSNRSSGIRGVSWDKSRGKWIATIGHNGKQRTIGRYATKEEAAAAAKAERLKLFTYNDVDRRPE